MKKETILTAAEVAKIKRDARSREAFKDTLKQGWTSKVQGSRKEDLKDKASRKDFREERRNAKG